MSKSYHCILCQNKNTSIMDLHNHHVQQHTSEELSCTIIDLQGFKSKDIKYLKSVILGDSNNNENSYKPVVHKTGKQNCLNETYCSLNCYQFVAWEHELNKRIEIPDDDFFKTIESLCSDLNKRKHRGIKRKKKSIISNTKPKDLIQLKENEEPGTESKTTEKLNHMPMKISTTTTTSHNTEDLVDNQANNNEISKMQITEPNTERNDITTLTIVKSEPANNVLIYNPLNGSFSWTPLVPMNFDEKQTRKEEENDDFVLQ